LDVICADKPIKLRPARPWRTYLGGYLLDVLEGVPEPKDGNFPEEWVSSVVTARNAGRERIVEGLSMVDGGDGQTPMALKDVIASAPADFLGVEHVRQYGGVTGVLVKLIDSAERLTIQTHPDKRNARALFQSDFGKTECWHILGGRAIGGLSPAVYLGFKPGVTREKWTDLFERQDRAGMLDCLHRFPANPGDTFLIEGGTPHAIGAGCFLVEIQEPTDYTIRVEKVTDSGLKIDDFMCHQGLGFERMFDCFDYAGITGGETYDKWRVPPSRLNAAAGRADEYDEYEIIGYGGTPFFRATIAEIRGGYEADCGASFSGLLILSGAGVLIAGGYERRIKKGDQFFMPAGIKRFGIAADPGGPVKAVRFFGPQTANARANLL